MATGLEQGGIRTASGAWWGVAGPARLGGLSVVDYAHAMAQRERILDEARVRKQSPEDGGALVGELGVAWSRLREHAARFGLPFIEGDLDATSRVRDWDNLVLNDAKTQLEWRREFPRAMLHACALDPEENAGRSAAAHLESQPSLLWNAFLPIHLRRPGVTDELRALAERARSSLAPPRVSGAYASVMHATATVFPGDRFPNLSDFARLQCAVQAGDFMAALRREGLDPDAYARLADRWAKRLEADPALRAEYTMALRRHSELAELTTTASLSIADTIVLPGQKLARVSDFARISRAAQRGEFKAALERAGIDADTFANLCARFNARMQEDPAIAEQFARMLSDPRLDAA